MIRLQEITVPGCIECRKFEEWWSEASKEFPGAQYEKIDATTPEGQAMVLQHQIFASPGIILNGELFSTGGVDKEKLLKKLRALSGP